MGLRGGGPNLTHGRSPLAAAAFTLTIGLPIVLGFQSEDQNGIDFVTPPGATMAWAQTTPATGTLTPSASKMSAKYTPIAAGTDVVTFTLTVSGAPGSPFTNTADITVNAASFLDGVGIVQIPGVV